MTDAEVDPFHAASADAARLADLTALDRHDVAVVLGSGWGASVEALGTVVAEVPFRKLPHFSAPTVSGHAGVVRSLRAGPNRLLVIAGRAHLYEGRSAAAVVHPVRMAVMAGCRTVLLTNAAGALRARLRVGQPVLISDHLNLTGMSPLVGPEPPPPHASRFCDLTEAYSPRLRAIARQVDPSLTEGVYAGLLGPSYETPAEIRMLQTLGADLVGMSTALETIAAVHLGAEVLGVSLVTNLAAGLSPERLDHGEVLAAGAEAAGHLGQLLRGVVDRL